MWNVAFYKLSSNSCVEAKRTEADAAADKIDGVVFDYVLSGEYSEETATGFVSLRAGDLGMVQSTVEVTGKMAPNDLRKRSADRRKP
ncbi:hypothetical protein [Bradyrhizobium cenepequi]